MISLEALRRSRLDLEAFASLAGEGLPGIEEEPRAQVILSVMCLRAKEVDEGRVREDPATGSGAAFLGAYLLKHRFFPRPDLSLRIEQGYEIRRPSLQGELI